MAIKKSLITISIVACFLTTVSSVLSKTIHVPRDYSKIQQAIDAAMDNDVILVNRGTYFENIEYKGKAIIVRSSCGPEATLIDGSQSGCVVGFNLLEGPDSILDGFTITNGVGILSGGGICCTSFTCPTIRNNIVTHNRSNTNGGGIYCGTYSSPIMSDNHIIHNQAENGGGCYCDRYSTPTIENNTLNANQTIQRGAGIYTRDFSKSRITGNIIKGNRACSCYGGGIYCGMSSNAVIDNNIIENNEIEGHDGGGIYGDVNAVLLIKGNIIYRNKSNKRGGGICCEHYCDVKIEDNVIKDNISGFYGAGISCQQCILLTINNNDIMGNCSDTSGGGIYCHGVSPAIENNRIFFNYAEQEGGGIRCGGSSPIIINNILFGNQVSKKWVNKRGGGIYLGGSDALIINSTIVCNSAFIGGGICCYNNSSSTIVNTIIWDNNPHNANEIYMGEKSNPSKLTISYSDLKYGKRSICMEGGCVLDWGPGMIDADPLFVNEAEGDFHLTYPSPCRDTGDNGAAGLPPEDFEGDPRSAHRTADMGADEFHTHLYCSGEATPGIGVNVNIVGLPFKDTLLCVGQGVMEPPVLTKYGAWYLRLPVIPVATGFVPWKGVSTLRSRIPAGYPVPSSVPLQAFVRDELTNLFELKVK